MLYRMVAASALFSCVLFAGTAGAQAGDPTLAKQIADATAKARTGKTLTIRTQGAWDLVPLICKADPDRMDGRTVSSLISLLDSPDDSVRAYTAGAIGCLGPRGKPAVPTLLRLLPAADCLNGTITSAGFIRTALKRIGVTPPPAPTCKTIGG